MAVHLHSEGGGRPFGSHMPLSVALAILPTLPRPLLARLVASAIDRLDRLDRDADLEPEATEQDDEPEMDDEPEENDPGGGDANDEGEAENGRFIPAYGIDQSRGPLPVYTH